MGPLSIRLHSRSLRCLGHALNVSPDLLQPLHCIHQDNKNGGAPGMGGGGMGGMGGMDGMY
jgi:hypothetical protein